MKDAVTLRDVANAARVSKATVSNVFSRPERVRPELRARIEAVASELGYAGPDPKGRLLSSGKFNAIGFLPAGAYGICGAFSSDYVRDFLHGVSEVCEEHGASLTLVSGMDDKRAAGIKNALVDGFILGSEEDAALVATAERRGVPIVLMDEGGGPDVSSVRIAEADGARQATQHLLDLGHRRFTIMTVLRQQDRAAVFHAPTGSRRKLVAAYSAELERLAGVAEALAAAGVSINDVPIVESGADRGASVGSATEGASLLLDKVAGATAVIALADSLALAMLKEAHRRGIDVPKELSVVGFDDAPNAASSNPPLTTVAQPTEEKGRVAARLLLENGPPRQVVLPVELRIRSSTAPPPN